MENLQALIASGKVEKNGNELVWIEPLPDRIKTAFIDRIELKGDRFTIHSTIGTWMGDHVVTL